MRRFRVLLADDHKPLVEHVAQMLKPEFEVVGAVADGRSAVAAATQLKPDILVLDISMPILTGLEALRELRKIGSRTKVVFLTIHEEGELVRESFASGASGYVIKPRLGTDLVAAIREALAGRHFVSPPLSLSDSASG